MDGGPRRGPSQSRGGWNGRRTAASDLRFGRVFERCLGTEKAEECCTVARDGGKGYDARWGAGEGGAGRPKSVVFSVKESGQWCGGFHSGRTERLFMG